MAEKEVKFRTSPFYGAAIALTIALVFAKAFGSIDIPWWLVFLPLMVVVAVILITIALFMLVLLVSGMGRRN
jgi:hypothetical protein